MEEPLIQGNSMASSSALFELATVFYSCRTTDALLKTFAGRLGKQMGARAVQVWLRNAGGTITLESQWLDRGEHFPLSGSDADGMLTSVLESGEVQTVTGREVQSADLGHLDDASRARIKAALYAPIPGAMGNEGVVEILNPRLGAFQPEEIAFTTEAARITGLALEERRSIEQQRHAQLTTIERLTSLYDIASVFNSTLELEDLLPVVAEKISNILAASVANVWLADPASEELELTQQFGDDPSAEVEARIPVSEGLLGEVVRFGRPRRVDHPQQEPWLVERQQDCGDFEIHSWMAAPLLKDEHLLGVIEVLNKKGGERFSDEDEFFFGSICQQAAIALQNANRLKAERKVHELGALLTISKEITSTLDLNRVLTTVVNQAALVVPFDRCAIGFIDRGKFALGAVSGETEVPRTREMDRLRDLLAWTSERQGSVSANRREGGWNTEPEETDPRLVPYLTEFGFGGLYALPLRDEEGSVGALALLSHEPDFLHPGQLETLEILANQATVAIRNAQLYQQVPLVGLLKPLARRKARLRWLGSGRAADLVGAMLLTAIVLTIVPWKLRVEANATVVPAEHAVVSAETSGIIRRVFVHEGDRVQKGQALAQLDDSAERVHLAQAEAELSIAQRAAALAADRRDTASAARAQLEAQQHQVEANLYRQHVENAQLRAPISGTVVTPKVEELAGKMLNAGDTFCQLVDQKRMAAEMNVPESDLALLRTGASAAIKLNAFPTLTLRGNVERLGTQSVTEENEQFFVVRVLFDNPEGVVREGMVGKGKITAQGGWAGSGWYPAGYVLFRAPFCWVWRKAWSWTP
jgi:RND family efflux transporter MFP subunit